MHAIYHILTLDDSNINDICSEMLVQTHLFSKSRRVRPKVCINRLDAKLRLPEQVRWYKSRIPVLLILIKRPEWVFLILWQ